ncbi:MAG: Ig-like domain-containing protein [Chloroflexi bacterium]|nr:Ig-like domain-containing protein [Chloroflexota bacterium]
MHRPLGLVTTILLAVLLFGLGQTAGETAAFMTDTQSVNANTFSSAAVFAPSGVSAQATGSAIAVSWSAVGFSVSGYNVYRATASGGPYTKVNGSVVTATTYNDTGLSNGAYYYVVRLVNARSVESATNSSEVSATADDSLPSSTISAPVNGGYVTTTPYSVTGTASDTGSGVQKVEVSTDGGATWNNATGTTSWTYSWVWAANGSYTVQSRATDNAGNVQSPVTSVTVTADGAAPHVVPPAYPADGTTGYDINRSVSVWFSEQMNQSSVQSAFSLKRCTTSACVSFSSTWTAPTNGAISWQGAGGNIMRFESSANMTASAWYQISVTTAAQDLSGRALASAFTSTFQTSATTDSSASSLTISAPTSATYTSASTYTITGTSSALWMRAYRDNAPTGSFGVEDTLAASAYAYSGASNFSLPVTLTNGTANRFIVTATDAANNVSTPEYLPIIYQGETRTLLTGGDVVEGNSNINIFLPYLGDSNGNNSATVRWRTPAVGGTYGAAVPVARYADYFGHMITGLSPSTSYRVEVTVNDADGFAMGTSVNTWDVTTSAGSTSGLISSISSGSIRLASRSGQTSTLRADVTGLAKYVQFTISTGTAKVSSCLTPSGGIATYAWDGSDGAGNPVGDSSYAWHATAYPTSATGCSGTAETMNGYIYVSNPESIAMSPLPAAVTLGVGESACVTATARNRQGFLVEDGAAITFSLSSSPAGGSYTLTQPATGKIGSAASGCSAPAAGSGQAVAKVTVNTAVPSSIYVTATMNTQLSGTTLTTVSGSTSLNDPPSTPEALEVALVQQGAAAVLTPARMAASPPAAAGLGVRFQPPARKGTASGYRLLIGTAPGAYTRTVDLGPNTAGSVTDGLVPGTRYYVAVQAYNKVGVASRPSPERTILLPADTAVTTLELQPAAGRGPVALTAGQSFSVKVTAKNRAGQPVPNAPIGMSGPAGLRFDPARGVTGLDGSLTVQVMVEVTQTRPAMLHVSNGALEGTLEIQPSGVLPTTTTTVTATTTATTTATVTPTGTLLPTQTISPTATTTQTAQPTLTVTATATLATSTPTPTPPPTVSPTTTPVSTTSPTPTTAPTVPPTATVPPTQTVPPTPTAQPSATAPATATAQPTSTAHPTSTPAATATALPTLTRTPTPAPTALPTVTVGAAATPARSATRAPDPTVRPIPSEPVRNTR